MPFKKGHTKTGGRTDGKKNKVSTEIKEFYASLLDSERGNIKIALEKLRAKDDYQYLMAIDKISNKVIASKKDITSDDKPIQTVPITGVNIIEDESKELPSAKTS